MRLRLLEPGSERGAQAGIERHRLESALIGGAAQCIKIQPSRGKQAFAGIGGKPTLCRQARLGIHRARQIELRARPTVLYHAPAITGAGIVVDDQSKSDERRVGKAGVSTVKYRCATEHSKKQKKITT